MRRASVRGLDQTRGSWVLLHDNSSSVYRWVGSVPSLSESHADTLSSTEPVDVCLAKRSVEALLSGMNIARAAEAATNTPDRTAERCHPVRATDSTSSRALSPATPVSNVTPSSVDDRGFPATATARLVNATPATPCSAAVSFRT